MSEEVNGATTNRPTTTHGQTCASEPTEIRLPSTKWRNILKTRGTPLRKNSRTSCVFDAFGTIIDCHFLRSCSPQRGNKALFQ